MSITLPPIPGVIAPPDPTAKPSPRSGTPDGPSAPPADAVVIAPRVIPSPVDPTILKRVQEVAGLTSAVQPSPTPPAQQPAVPQQQATNPVAIPTEDADLPPKPVVKPPSVPVEQRMAAARDLLNAKLATAGFPSSATTIRLDVTSSGPGIEFIVYSSKLPDTTPPTRYGTLGKYPTIKAVEDAINSFVP